MKLKNIIAFVALVTTFSACDDLFEPSVENAQTADVVFQNASSAQGILGYAYANLPFETKSTTDIATDDAVTNDLENNYRKMAQGSWTASNDPMSQWVARKATIQYLNVFIENVETVKWSASAFKQQMFMDHARGQAYALRALNMYYLLRNHGGWVGDKLFGVPIINYVEGPGTDFNQPRATFQACVEQIYADVEAAIANTGAEVAWTAENSTIGAEPEFLLGDVSGDGVVDISDATLIQMHAAKLETLTEEQLKAADTTKDGKVDVVDATTIQYFVAKLITEF